jgi:hypothetical protein
MTFDASSSAWLLMTCRTPSGRRCGVGVLATRAPSPSENSLPVSVAYRPDVGRDRSA